MSEVTSMKKLSLRPYPSMVIFSYQAFTVFLMSINNKLLKTKRSIWHNLIALVCLLPATALAGDATKREKMAWQPFAIFDHDKSHESTSASRQEASLPIIRRQLLHCVIKTDSAQSWSNKCKNYLLKIYSQHINFLNTIWNFSLKFISPGDRAMKIPSIFEKFNVEPRKNASCLCF